MQAGKENQLGAIPKGWRASRMGDEANLLTGLPFPSSGFTAAGVRLLRGSNVKRGVIDWSIDITQHWPAIDSKSIDYALKANDIVIAMDGALVGRSYARIDAADLPALLVQRVARLRSRTATQGLLHAWVASEFFVRHIDLVKTHTAIPHISPKDIREFSIILPTDKLEQESIAAALSDIDALLSGLDRLIAKKRDLKQAAMQQLLTGKTRLPGFEGEWEVKCLAELADIRSGGTPNTSDNAAWDGDVPWCTPTDITALAGKKYLSDTSRKITPYGLKISSAEIIPAGSVVMTSRATIGECGWALN